MGTSEYNTAETLLALGFIRHPEWDWQNKRYPDGAITSTTEHYRLETPNATFRAYEVSCNGPRYVKLAKTVNEAGGVSAWGWMDCVSNGSIARKIAL